MTRTRRGFILTGAAGLATLAAPALAQQAAVDRNVSALQRIDWRDHFDALGLGIIIADTEARAVHYWGPDGDTYRLYPSSVPVSDELTRRGYTEVVRKVDGPTWTPTPSMRERDPSLPKVVAAGPDNPLGTHALYLSWQYYRIHGTHDTRKIGRPSSDGCIGLYNEHIAQLYSLAEVGTQVRLI